MQVCGGARFCNRQGRGVKSTWAKLQAAHGDVLANLRMQPTKVDLGEKGTWYRVQAGPLDEKQAHSICGTLKSRKTDCVVVAPAR